MIRVFSTMSKAAAAAKKYKGVLTNKTQPPTTPERVDSFANAYADVPKTDVSSPKKEKIEKFFKNGLKKTQIKEEPSKVTLPSNLVIVQVPKKK